MKNPHQYSFKLRTHGGARKGAGRKNTLREVAHAKRTRVTKHNPIHCGIKMHPQAPKLRNAPMFTAITDAFIKAREKGLRVTEFSIEANHIHFLAEADTTGAISRGLMSITASITWALRKIFAYYGAVIAKRYFLHVIRKPREMFHALCYVLFNHAKHLKVDWFADPYSSAHARDDLDRFLKRPGNSIAWTKRVKRARSIPESWLHRGGWKKWARSSIGK